MATRFVRNGWSLKQLHRLILTSATFRQSSTVDRSSAAANVATRIDPENRLLWRMNAHRMTFEEFRDSLFVAAGNLDLEARGKPVDLLKAPFPNRRTLYGLVDRQFLPAAFRTFDFANPDLHIPQRAETTVPQQALFLLNHPLVLAQARQLAASSDQDSPTARVEHLFQQVLQRNPSRTEVNEALSLVNAAAGPGATRTSPTEADWQYGYGAFDETAQRVTGFTPLPHFTGDAWQGGPNWPDTKLGWVQLTATGGHPGNTRLVAAVRRWVAPRAMTVSITSKLIHEAQPGDGIRAFVVSSQQGVLAQAILHQDKVSLDAELEVQPGDTIDFVVDIDKILNSDQYLWEASIIEVPKDSNTATRWNSKEDFPSNTVAMLTVWEQLAQVLFCSNEFFFID